jgi:hypothetical protein
MTAHNQLIVRERTYKVLSSFKENFKIKSYDKAISLLLDFYNTKQLTPRQQAIEEIGAIIDKYHYTFSAEDKHILEVLPALIRSNSTIRKTILNNLSQELEEVKGQTQIINQAEETAGLTSRL